MRLVAVTRRLLRQFARDRRTLALVFVAPVVVLSLLSLIFNSGDYHPRIAAVDLPAPFAAELTRNGATVRALAASEADAELRANRVDGVVELRGGRPAVRIEGSDPTVTRSVLFALQRAQAALMPFARATQPEISFLHGSPTMSAFDNFGPVLVGFLVFFFVFLISGISFVRERTTGTLDRMLATPLRRWEIVVGYAFGFAALVIVQSTIIALVSVYLLGMMLVGSFAYLLLITLLLAGAAMTVGMLLSAFARNEFQMIQFIPLIIVPQIFFSGLFNLETMKPWLRALGRAFPLTYGAHAMREVMIRGGGAREIAVDVVVLVGFSLLCLGLNVIALKKYRRI